MEKTSLDEQFILKFLREYVLSRLDKIFYINLDHRTDRREEIEKELRKLEIPDSKVERISAVRDSNGSVGCYLSHMNIIQICKERGYKNVMVLEDDFLPVFPPIKIFQDIAKAFYLDIPYDALQLEYLLKSGEPYNDFLGKVNWCQNTSAFIIRDTIFDRFLEVAERGLKKLRETGDRQKYSIDVVLSELQSSCTWLYFLEQLSIQRGGYSDILNKETAVTNVF